jgi:hypothetical protein
MKWYKAIVDLKDHRKRFELEAELNTIHGLHYIHCWFSHVAKFYENGDVSKVTANELARVCEWKGEEQTIFDAFLKTGFIDKIGKKLVAHDWFQENSRFLKENSKPKYQGKPKGKPREPLGKPVLQYSTVQDSTGQDKKQLPPSAWDRFWAICDRKKAVTEAKKAFLKLNPTEQEQAIKAWPNHSALWKKENRDESKKPYPATWINKGQWQDDLGDQVPKELRGREACHAYGHTMKGEYNDPNDPNKKTGLYCSRCGIKA